MVNDMRRDLYAHLQRLSLAFHNRRQVGDLMYRVTADTYAIQSLTMNGVFPILTAMVLLGGMFYVMMKIDWQLTLLSLTVCPVLLASISLMSSRITDGRHVCPPAGKRGLFRRAAGNVRHTHHTGIYKGRGRAPQVHERKRPEPGSEPQVVHPSDVLFRHCKCRDGRGDCAGRLGGGHARHVRDRSPWER